MGRNFKNISAGERLIPHDGTLLGNVGGDLEALTSDGKAYYYNASQSGSSPLVTESHSATLINKSMDGGSNTFTNIPGSALAGNIPRSKIAADSANTIVVNDGSGLLSTTPILNVARGGTGASTLTGYVKGNGTSAFTASASIPSSDIAGLTVKNKSADYTLLPSDDVVFCNAATSFSITLPSAASNNGKYYRLEKIDTSFNAVTVGDLSSYSTFLRTQNESIDIVSDGTNWNTYSRNSTIDGTYVPTITTTGTNPTKGTHSVDSGYWFRRGNTMTLQYTYNQSAAGTAGTGSYLFSLPSPGTVIDNTKIGVATLIGNCTLAIAGATYTGNVYKSNDNNHVQLTGMVGTVETPVGNTFIALNNTAVIISFTATFPITAWSN